MLLRTNKAREFFCYYETGKRDLLFIVKLTKSAACQSIFRTPSLYKQENLN